MKNEKMWNNIYNVGTGRGTKIKYLVSAMLRELNDEREILYSGQSWMGDVQAVYADIGKIRSFGYEPLTDLDQGVKELIKREYFLKCNATNEAMSFPKG